MVEVLETGMEGKIMLYVTPDERKVLRKARSLRKEAAIYFDRKEQILAYHWLFRPSTIKKFKLGIPVLKLATE